MKKLNERQNNKGFSLVELIVVIAIMVVLVAVLAPVFSKYIESSRRSTDVQNASSIAEAVLADYADQKNVTASGYQPTAIKEWPVKTKGNAAAADTALAFEYDENSNHCAVFVTGKKGTKAASGSSIGYYSGDLTIEKNATAYKDADKGEFPDGSGK